MSRFLAGLPILCLLLVATACSRSRSIPPAVIPVTPPTTEAFKYKDYNLVFVSFDALQAAHVGCLGHNRNTTPAIDAMAERSLRFTQTYSVASWTVPASMTWFTGVYPSEHQITNKFAIFKPPIVKKSDLRELSPKLVTLADVLKANGYATAGFTGNAGVSGGFGYEQGFDIYFHEIGKFGSMDLSVPKSLEWLAENRDKKFFLFLHGYDIHGQSTPATGYDYRFVDENYDGKFLGSAMEQEALREEGLVGGALTMRDADVQFWRAIYDEKIQRTDAKFREFLEEFDKLGLTDRTLFVLTSDHGTELYEHRRFDHGFTLYNELLHVPLFITLPDGTNGQTIDSRVGSIDVMPTILELLDIPLTDAVRKQLRGDSLIPAAKGESIERNVYSETNYRDYTFQRSVITPEGWKYIVHLEDQTQELFHLPSDPGEQNDRSRTELDKLTELREQLYAHFRAIGHGLEERRWEVGLNPVYDSQAPRLP